MTWDLRERVLIAKWESEGHALRSMRDGVACCLRCETIIHVGARAAALAGLDDGRQWRLPNDPAVVRRCKGRL